MKIFISYKQAETREIAEAINLCLRSDGHQVFFDQTSLPVGGTFDNRIREALDASDLFIFLISPDAVKERSYTLTELDYASKKWPNPDRRIIPVLAVPTDFDSIPTYLKAVNILKPKGNIAAEVCGVVGRISDSKRNRLRVVAGLLFSVFVAIALYSWIPQFLFSTSSNSVEFEKAANDSLKHQVSRSLPMVEEEQSASNLEQSPNRETEIVHSKEEKLMLTCAANASGEQFDYFSPSSRKGLEFQFLFFEEEAVSKFQSILGSPIDKNLGLYNSTKVFSLAECTSIKMQENTADYTAWWNIMGNDEKLLNTFTVLKGFIHDDAWVVTKDEGIPTPQNDTDSYNLSSPPSFPLNYGLEKILDSGMELNLTLSAQKNFERMNFSGVRLSMKVEW